MKKLLLTLLCSISAHNFFAGVIISTKVPQESGIFITALQASIQQILSENKQALFDPAEYHPHVTLAFLTSDTLTVEEILEKKPELLKKLEEIASRHKAFNVNTIFNNAELAYWYGQCSIKRPHEAIERNNYCNIVLKLGTSDELTKLATAFDQLSEQDPYFAKRQFPFSAHITLGRVFEQHEGDVQPFIDQVKHNIQDVCRSKLPLQSLQQMTLNINSFVLRGEDKTERIFTLNE